MPKRGRLGRRGLGGGMPSRPSKNRGQPRRPARSEQNPQQKSFLFLLEEKIRRAQFRKDKECFAWRRASASGGGAASFVGSFPKMRSDFVQGAEPKKTDGFMRRLFFLCYGIKKFIMNYHGKCKKN